MHRLTRRTTILVGVVALAAAFAGVAWRAPGDPAPSQLTWIATAHQYGPVGYRDPAAAISPDGRWLAYSEGRFLRVRAIAGGPVVEFPAGNAQIRHLSWRNNTLVLAGADLYDRVEGTRKPLWPDRTDLSAQDGSVAATVATADLLRQALWSPDGESLAAIVAGRNGSELWTARADGTAAHVRLLKTRAASPAWTPRGDVACIATSDGRQRITLPCGESPIRFQPDRDAYGPLAFSPDGATAYAGLPGESGTLDLWAVPVAGGSAQRLSNFSRDSYAPSVAGDGTVVFKSQSYHTMVAVAASDGTAMHSLARFQTETPSWDPTGRWIGVTFGTWRRVVDDAHYPDIAQDIGVIAADATEPAVHPDRIIQDSSSEDQSLCWSPNGKWIAFHSHQDQSDDIWLRPADGDGKARRVSMLGRGAETGWPRWSPDGRWLLFEGASRQTRRTVLYVLGVDQNNGSIPADASELAVSGVDAEIGHGEWLPDSRQLVVEATEAPGRHVIFTLDRSGGAAHVVHRFESEHEHPGLAASPDGREVAFVAPDRSGYFQVFRLPLSGGEPRQVTTDPSHKTQPAWSPDGRRIAFTVWEYNAQLWVLRR